ncbi:MAG: hypothetical protein GTO45_32590 [Candidatus Aminicenantes bacterium]|nr:hypothetical protein [Candidatus Aminicenantes bacterium]NIM83489.1 hypothetical protein [Candidatus Aminicenantes bacterium]NIN22881.1 hypothetical protein [Candidatus Aminicenantes bacterium]NIN46617.1 hypothetical protein [Candidatus Aminicenantes bacterium]NIN89520.1 hypothetical protein [Candidatus Aminicenantes bacterium]
MKKELQKPGLGGVRRGDILPAFPSFIVYSHRGHRGVKKEDDTNGKYLYEAWYDV